MSITSRASLLPATDPGVLMRRGLLGIAALGVIGTMAELAALRHWDGPEQMVPWVVLALLGLVIVAVAVRPVRPVVAVTRVVSLVGLAATVFGIWEHIDSNIATAPLDRVWGPKWASLSGISKLWHAMNGDVGPSPLLAPGAIGVVCLCLALSTVGLPTGRSER